MNHDQTMEFLFRKNPIKKIIEKTGVKLWADEDIYGCVLEDLDAESLKDKLNI